MKIGTYTATHSDLYWKVHRIYHSNDKYVKARITFFYKSSNDICGWLSPSGRGKNYKLDKKLTSHWSTYEG